MSYLPDEYGNTYGICPGFGNGYGTFNTMGMPYGGMNTMGLGGMNTNYLKTPAPLDAFVHREKDETAFKAVTILGAIALAAGALIATRGKNKKILKEVVKATDDVIKPATEEVAKVADDVVEKVAKKSKYTLARGKYKIKTPQVIKTGGQEVSNVVDDVANPVVEVVKNPSEAAPTFYNKPKSPSKVKTSHHWEYTAEQARLEKQALNSSQAVEEVKAVEGRFIDGKFYPKSSVKALNAPEVHPQLEYKPLPEKVIKLGNQSSGEVIYLGEGSNSVRAMKRASRNPNASGVKGRIKLTETRIPMEGGGNTIVKTNPITKAKVQQINVDPRGRIEQVTKFDSKTGKVVEDIQYTKGQLFGSTKYDPNTGAKIEETVIFDGGKGIRKYNPETGKLTEEINFKGDKIESVTRYDEAGKRLNTEYPSYEESVSTVQNDVLENIPADKRIIETPYEVNVPKEPLIESAYVNIPKEPIIESAYLHKPTGPIIESAYIQKPKGDIILP